MKNKRIIYVCLIIFMILSFLSNVYATSYIKTKLNVIVKSAETSYAEDNQDNISISESIVNIDSDKGKVKVQLKLSNNNKEEESSGKINDTEIFIIVPEYTNAKENETITYIETLASKVLQNSTNIKIGVIGIKGPKNVSSYDENGNIVPDREKDEARVNGTANNAECIVNLTNNLDDIKSGLRNMNSQNEMYYANFQAAIRLAKNSFSKSTNKILISLYDNVPFTTIGTSNTFYYGENNTLMDAAREHLSAIVRNTKTEILSLKNNNINFILLRPDDTDFSKQLYDINTGEFSAKIDGKEYADDLYGTLSNPTYGKMYSLNNDSLEKIITEYIYNDVKQIIKKDMINVVIKKYFTKDIVDNFDLVISEKNNSNVDVKNLKSNNFIVWNIGNLECNKSAILEYTLNIKDMENANLMGKAVNINKKAEAKYVDYLKEEKTRELMDSPVIKLELAEVHISSDDEVEDNTIAKDVLPKTGKGIILGIGLSIPVIIGIVFYKKYKDIYK